MNQWPSVEVSHPTDTVRTCISRTSDIGTDIRWLCLTAHLGIQMHNIQIVVVKTHICMSVGYTGMYSSTHFWDDYIDKETSLTAIVFSLIPPTGSTLPRRDTSPVIATFCLIGRSIARDNSAVTIVQPALGPSFGTAPYINDKCNTFNGGQNTVGSAFFNGLSHLFLEMWHLSQ